MTSARFCACGKPAKVILVPAAKCCGSSSHSLSNSGVHFWPLCLLSASENEYPPRSSAIGWPTTFHKFGPILFGPPLVKSWQAWHTAVSCWPFFGSALANNGPIGGSAGAAGAAAAVGAGSPPATTNTGFSSGVGCTSMLDRIPATIATISAVRTEAMILFHSNDDIDDPSDRAGPAEDRIPPDNSNELSRFRRVHEPGILSLPDHPSLARGQRRTPKPDHRDPCAPRGDPAAWQAARRDRRRADDRASMAPRGRGRGRAG